MNDYQQLRSINLQGGLNTSAPLLSPASQASLADSYNAIVSGDQFIRPYSGQTSQGSGTGGNIMLQFGNDYGAIRSYQYADNSFSTASIAANVITTTTPHGYITGLLVTTSGATAPTGLPSGSYYAIVTGASTMKFAATLALALAGTALPISNAVTSTITLDVSNSAVTASGSFFQDIGLSRWGIGAGQPMIAGVPVPGFTLSTNLQVQIPASGAYGAAIQAGLSQPSAPDIAIINTSGTVTNSVSAKIERTRPSTGANSVASLNSQVIFPQANRIRVTFPLAQTGQEAWRVFFTFQGFGGTGVSYLATYGDYTDIPESVVAAGQADGVQATGSLTVVTQPTATDTISVNGVTLTFIAGASTATDVQIGADVVETAANLAAVLSASVNASLILANYSAAANIVSITYTAQGTAGNAYTLADSSGGDVVRSAATLTGGVNGISRSLEFNYQDGDLLPIEASFDDYPPPAATHAIRLNTVMNLAGCYSDSVTDPTSASPGTCIAVSKENNYESYIPTSLLYLPEQVVDVLARPSDDYGYVAGQNSVTAIQYVGDRGDGLPPCIVTTVLPDIGVQYPQNWCQFRGRLLIYTAKGNLMLMESDGSFDTSFASPVSKILKGFTTVATSVAYDPKNDSIVVLNGKQMLVYSIQAGQWRKIFLPDYGITSTCVSAVSAKRELYFTLTDGTTQTAYTYDTGSATAPIAVVSNYQNAGGSVLNDIYEMAIAATTNVSTRLAVVINSNLSQTVFREVGTTASNATVTTPNADFTSDMVNKKVILFGTNIGGGSTVLHQTTVASYTNTGAIVLVVAPSATLTNVLMFVGNYAASAAITGPDHLPNFFPNLTEQRSWNVACWIQGSGDVGNVLTCDVNGAAYASSRAL